MSKFRKKPIVINAVQWNGFSLADAYEIKDELNPSYRVAVNSKGQMLIETLEGTMAADKGDWIIKGISGELYPCKPDIFEKTYESV